MRQQALSVVVSAKAQAQTAKKETKAKVADAKVPRGLALKSSIICRHFTILGGLA